MRPLCDHYHMKRLIGEGSYGQVFMGQRKDDGKTVALKLVKQPISQKRFDSGTERELKVLMQVQHQNIAEFIEVCQKQRGPTPDLNSFFFVFDFYPYTLRDVLSDSDKFPIKDQHKKTMLHHILKGLDELHRQRFMHRDIKPDNILVSKEGVLKLADFSLVKPLPDSKHVGHRPSHRTPAVHITYRPPEILLGDKKYTEKIDIWGVGCLMARMWLKKSLFEGRTERDQYLAINEVCGPIDETVMPDCSYLPNWRAFTNVERSEESEERTSMKLEKLPRMFRKRMTSLAGFNLLKNCLEVNPAKRIPAKKALKSHWFADVLPDVRDLITHNRKKLIGKKSAMCSSNRDVFQLSESWKSADGTNHYSS